MAQLPASSLNVPGVNLRGVFFGIIVVGLIAALFFIPEIIDYQRSSRGAKPAETGAARASGSIFSGDGESPLTKLKKLLHSGFTDQTQAKKAVERRDVPSGVAPNPIPKAPEVAWTDLRSKEAKKQLQDADASVGEVIRSLPAAKAQSRYALLTLSSGIRNVAAGDADKILSPAEAIRFLEYLHENVTRSLTQENVERPIFQRWQKVNFGSLISQSSRILEQQAIPYTPRVVLTTVSAMQQKRTNQFETQSPPSIGVKGFVVGTETSRIEIWNPQTLLRSIKMGQPDQRGRIYFSADRLDGTTLLTFRLISKNNQKFEKVYQFYPRFKIFPYKNGRFEIPVASSLNDTSLDRFFTREVLGDGSGGGFFGGPLIARF